MTEHLSDLLGDIGELSHRHSVHAVNVYAYGLDLRFDVGTELHESINRYLAAVVSASAPRDEGGGGPYFPEASVNRFMLSLDNILRDSIAQTQLWAVVYTLARQCRNQEQKLRDWTGMFEAQQATQDNRIVLIERCLSAAEILPAPALGEYESKPLSNDELAETTQRVTIILNDLFGPRAYARSLERPREDGFVEQIIEAHYALTSGEDLVDLETKHESVLQRYLVEIPYGSRRLVTFARFVA